MQFGDLQIIVMRKAHTSYQMKRSKQKEYCSPTDIFQSEKINRLKTSAMLAAKISSGNA